MHRLAIPIAALAAALAAATILGTSGDLPERVATSLSSDAEAGG